MKSSKNEEDKFMYLNACVEVENVMREIYIMPKKEFTAE